MNVLIDEDCNITGLIDWELSTPVPFGVCFNRIHTFAGEYFEGEFCVPDEFEDAERALSDVLFDRMPKKCFSEAQKSTKSCAECCDPWNYFE